MCIVEFSLFQNPVVTVGDKLAHVHNRIALSTMTAFAAHVLRNLPSMQLAWLHRVLFISFIT
uniref:Uncharacterized protein n=1 Tax=Anguilla anguilla TaxID=7936 RepID=A0A0E9WK05_ANGAN